MEVRNCVFCWRSRVQIRMQSTMGAGTGRGMIGSFIDIYKLEGVKGLYRGARWRGRGVP